MKILLCTAALALSVACVAQAPIAPNSTPPAKPMTEEQRLQLANPSAPPPAPGGNASAQARQAAPLPWGGVPLTEDQRLKLENAQLKIQNVTIAARASYQAQMQQQIAPYLEDRRSAAAEVVKAHPDFTWDDNAGTFRKKAVEPEVPAAPAVATPTPPVSKPKK